MSEITLSFSDIQGASPVGGGAPEPQLSCAQSRPQIGTNAGSSVDLPDEGETGNGANGNEAVLEQFAFKRV
jgi:hypothetical protein